MKKSIVWVWSLILTSLPGLVLAKDLILFGSQLQLCSSDMPSNCITAQFPPQAKTQANYKFSTKSLTRFKKSLAFKHLSERTREILTQLLDSAFVQSQMNELDDLRAHQFLTGLVNTLPKEQKLALNQYLDHTPSQQIMASLSLTENIYSSVLLERFARSVSEVSSANTPKVGIISLGSNSPYLHTHRYQQIISQLGFEPVWLPFSAHLAQSITDHHCNTIDLQRQQHYFFNVEYQFEQLADQELIFCQQPHLFEETITTLDGIIFLEGDQNIIAHHLTLPLSPFHLAFKRIMQRFNQHKLTVAAEGTSVIAMAGGHNNAFPTPMLRGGTDLSAFQHNPTPTPDTSSISDTLVHYRANGGLGLLNIGPADVYISESEHLGRLAIISAATHQKYAIGIDSDTGLFIRSNPNETIQVIGKAGVYLLNFEASYFHRKNEFSQVIFQSNYLLHGHSATLNNSTNKWVPEISSPKLENNDNRVWPGYLRHRINRNCHNEKPIRFTYDGLNYVFASDANTQFINKKQAGLCGYINLKVGIDNKQY